MSFDVVFVVVNDQRRLLLEQSKPQYGVGDAGLLRNRCPDHSARAVEQISSRVRSLSALFALFSDQTCAADFCPVRCRSSFRNSIVLFSLTKAAIGILFASPKTRTFDRLESLDFSVLPQLHWRSSIRSHNVFDLDRRDRKPLGAIRGEKIGCYKNHALTRSLT